MTDPLTTSLAATSRPIRPLAGRVALVTGVSANIGTGIALGLAGAGAAVACVDLDHEMAKRAVGEIEGQGGRAIGLGLDVTDPDAVDAAVQGIASELGVVDLLVNGAVVYDTRGVLDMPIEGWRRQLRVMLDGTFLCTSAVTRALIADGRPGSVVNLLSTAAHQGEVGNIGYATAKGGLANFTRSAAMELAPFGIRVNSLTPTATDPGEWIDRANRWGTPPPDADMIGQLRAAADQVPLRQLPLPSDYAAAIVFLASDAARMMTGTDLVVDAGALANYWRRLPEPDAS